jgi:zinc and cadmium transporter
MTNFILAITASLIVSLISLIGIFSLTIKENILHKILFGLIGFSAGALIGSAFLHILPEVLKESENTAAVFYFVIAGIVLFFLMERYFYWRHCHEGVCDVHAFTYLNLIGDGLHNFIDGMVIAASFIVSVRLGVITTLAVVLHEIPQELGDFGVLIYGGFTKKKALFYNYISAFMAVVGTILGFVFSDVSRGFSNFILPLTAGGFIYVASSDLIPEIHKESDRRRSGLAMLSFLFGIVFMAWFKLIFAE